jgi:membrane-bound serine protease (ClpP class)
MLFLSCLLVIVGCLFIFLEFFLPGGIAAVIGGLFILGSVFLVLTSSFSIGLILTYVFLFLGLLISTFYIALKIIKKSSKKKSFYNDTDQSGYLASSFSKEMVGKKAKTLSDLKPSGHIFLENKTFLALSDHDYIEKDREVEVLGGDGNYLIVRAVQKSI